MEQVLEALYALMIQRVQSRLPPTKRGLRARDAIKARVPFEVAQLMTLAVEKIAKEVAEEVPDVVPFGEAVCDTCGNKGTPRGCPACGQKVKA